uniref:DUF4331 domain-containing protein n=1 Tax=Cyanothece sp. (strain PCC 7425 / ATCC 29141) TaxID=395961 RepID=B8HRN7_CYAP4
MKWFSGRVVGVITLSLGMAITALGINAATKINTVSASDHDDGEYPEKGRNRNITDLYVFREVDQNKSANPGDLVFVFNTNPRSLPRQQYYFDPNARYEINLTRVADLNSRPTGQKDVTLRFTFAPPSSNQQFGQQNLTLTVIDRGTTVGRGQGVTTPLDKARQPRLNQLTIGGNPVTVFAGLREDPFFFDVEQYFRVRAGVLGFGPAVGFRPASEALDFAKGYNVNAIAVRVPRKLLQGSTSVTTFDSWLTISVRTGSGGQFRQVERLARPAINEGLIVTNDFLNAFNSIPPSSDLSPAAAPVLAEAAKTLKALGNNTQEINTLVTALIPDVMRIDTTQPSGYVKGVNALNAPVRGRMLKDDVIDATLNLVTKGAVKSDNVSYSGPGGNPAQGHDPLVRNFPYLALPN